MSRVSRRDQSIPLTTIDRILKSYPNLDYQKRTALKNYLVRTQIRSALIRETIIEEGNLSKKGILVLDGTLIITKRVLSTKVVFSQLNSLQIANIQVFLYDKANYTASVHSSQAKFIEIQQEIMEILFQYLRDLIIAKEKSRAEQIRNKMKQIQQAKTSKQKQKMVNRLSLPAIKYFSKQGQISIKVKPVQKPKGSIGQMEEQSPRKLQRYASQNHNEPQLKIRNSSIHRPFKFKSQFQNGPQRNERLFKQQLKSIIKRKLVFERKQFVQKKNKQSKPVQKHQYQFRSISPREKLDQYFNI